LQYFEKVFVCGFDILLLCCSCFAPSAFISTLPYIHDLFHIQLLSLQTYGSMECMYGVSKSSRTESIKKSTTTTTNTRWEAKTKDYGSKTH